MRFGIEILCLKKSSTQGKNGRSYLAKGRADPIVFKTVGGSLRGAVLLGMSVGRGFCWSLEETSLKAGTRTEREELGALGAEVFGGLSLFQEKCCSSDPKASL